MITFEKLQRLFLFNIHDAETFFKSNYKQNLCIIIIFIFFFNQSRIRKYCIDLFKPKNNNFAIKQIAMQYNAIKYNVMQIMIKKTHPKNINLNK